MTEKEFKEMVIKRWGLAYWQGLEDQVDDAIETETDVKKKDTLLT